MLWGRFITLLVNHAPAHPLPSPPEHSLTRFVSGIFLMVFFPGRKTALAILCKNQKERTHTHTNFKKERALPYPGLPSPHPSPLPRRSVPLQAPASHYQTKPPAPDPLSRSRPSISPGPPRALAISFGPVQHPKRILAPKRLGSRRPSMPASTSLPRPKSWPLPKL